MILKIITIVSNVFVWTMSAGFALCAFLSFAGAVHFIDQWIHSKDPMDKKIDRDMLLILCAATVAMGIATTLTVLLALAIIRGI